MESNQKNNTNNSTNSVTKSAQENEKPKTGIGRFFSKVGYSIWIAVMVVGGVIAFLVSLFLV